MLPLLDPRVFAGVTRPGRWASRRRPEKSLYITSPHRVATGISGARRSCIGSVQNLPGDRELLDGFLLRAGRRHHLRVHRPVRGGSPRMGWPASGMWPTTRAPSNRSSSRPRRRSGRCPSSTPIRRRPTPSQPVPSGSAVVPECRRLPDRGRATGPARAGPGPELLMRTSGARSCYASSAITRPGRGRRHPTL
jgi:hypothetical protein